MTPYLQRPLFWSHNFGLYSINPSLNNDHLWTTAIMGPGGGRCTQVWLYVSFQIKIVKIKDTLIWYFNITLHWLKLTICWLNDNNIWNTVKTILAARGVCVCSIEWKKCYVFESLTTHYQTFQSHPNIWKWQNNEKIFTSVAIKPICRRIIFKFDMLAFVLLHAC